MEAVGVVFVEGVCERGLEGLVFVYKESIETDAVLRCLRANIVADALVVVTVVADCRLRERVELATDTLSPLSSFCATSA